MRIKTLQGTKLPESAANGWFTRSGWPADVYDDQSPLESSQESESGDGRSRSAGV
jgi:hypothetical protein